MPVSIKGTGGGSVTLSAAAAATDTTLTLPNTTGTVALTASPTFSGTLTATTITSPSATALTLQYGGTTGATLDTSGNLLVGTTSQVQQGKLSVVSSVIAASFSNSASSGGACIDAVRTSATGDMMYFHTSSAANLAGYITCPTSTTTNYVSVSDYRLKENVTLIATGLEKILALKPVTYDWINDKLQGEGFIAHEVQAVIPLAVAGEKDAVNKDGSIKPQGIDPAKIVVHLVAATKELSAKNDALEARLAALEAK